MNFKDSLIEHGWSEDSATFLTERQDDPRIHKFVSKLTGSIPFRLTTQERRSYQVHERCGWKCWYCGKDFLWSKSRQSRNIENLPHGPTVDHKIPQSRGGSEAVDNRVTCCRHCNSEKGTKTVEEYRQYLIGLHPAGKALYVLNDLIRRISDEIPMHVKDTLLWIDEYCPPIVFWGEKNPQS